MIEPANANLPIGKQCKLLSIPRSSFYYQPKGETALNLMLMRRIDEQFLETPFFGVRQMTWHLHNEGQLVNEKRIRRLMRVMGLMPIYQKPNTRCPAAHAKHVREGARQRRDTRPTPICCVVCGWGARTRSGRQTSPICQCARGSCIWWRSLTGTPARCWPGASRTRWKRTSVSRR